MEIVIGIIAIVVSIVLYYTGIREGKRQEIERHERELRLERERQTHERAMEEERRQHERISKVVDEYVSMARDLRDNGPHALSQLGLDSLSSDAAIREAIEEMQIRASHDPWAGAAQYVEDIDLVVFFRYVREHRISLFQVVNIESSAQQVRTQGHLRPRAGNPSST